MPTMQLSGVLCEVECVCVCVRERERERETHSSKNYSISHSIASPVLNEKSLTGVRGSCKQSAEAWSWTGAGANGLY
jgi:hypothetical protein